MALIRRCAALRPGAVIDPTTAAKHTLRAIARRWLGLDAEIKTHEQVLATLTSELVPDLVAAFGIGADIAAEILIVNPDRIRSEPAFARLCGVAPIPASPGMTTRHRLNRGGHRQANSALYRAVTVRLAPPTHPGLLPTQDGRGPTKAEIIRSLKRLLPREIWSHLRPLRQARQPLLLAA
jgi:transposase